MEVKSNAIKASIRWMIRRDWANVVAIESHEFGGLGMTSKSFSAYLCERNVIGMVADHGDLLAGYMIYRLERDRIRLSRFAVSGSFRRRGIGRQMIDKLKGKLGNGPRCRLEITIPESYFAAAKFFASQGFYSTLERGHFGDNEDGYEFAWDVLSG